MADVTAAPVPVGSSEFNPPLHFQQLAAHFGSPAMFAVANAAALPSSGNWQGRLLVTSDDGALYRWSGSWAAVSSDTGWVNATGFANGFTHGAEVVRMRRIGPVVYLRGGAVRVTGGAPTGGVGAFNIPAGWRPGAPVRWSARRDADVEVIVSGTNLSISSPTLLTSGSGYTLTGLSWVAEA